LIDWVVEPGTWKRPAESGGDASSHFFRERRNHLPHLATRRRIHVHAGLKFGLNRYNGQRVGLLPGGDFTFQRFNDLHILVP